VKPALREKVSSSLILCARLAILLVSRPIFPSPAILLLPKSFLRIRLCSFPSRAAETSSWGGDEGHLALATDAGVAEVDAADNIFTEAHGEAVGRDEAAGGEHAGHGHLLLAEPHQAVEGAAIQEGARGPAPEHDRHLQAFATAPRRSQVRSSMSIFLFWIFVKYICRNKVCVFAVASACLNFFYLS